MSRSLVAHGTRSLGWVGALLLVLLAGGAAGARTEELEFKLLGGQYAIVPRGELTVELHAANLPSKGDVFTRLAERLEAEVPGQLRGAGGAYLGNETSRHRDDASPAGLLIDSAVGPQWVVVIGVEPGARSRPEAHVVAARKLLGDRHTQQSGPALAARVLEHWRITGTRPRWLMLDVDGTLVLRYLVDAGSHRHATLAEHPELLRELVALVVDGHPISLVTRSPLSSVVQRVLQPLAEALPPNALESMPRIQVVSSSLTELHRIEFGPPSPSSPNPGLELITRVDRHYGREYEIDPSAHQAVLEVADAPGDRGFLTRAHATTRRWIAALRALQAEAPGSARARWYARGLGRLADSRLSDAALRIRCEARPEGAPRVIVFNPIPPADRWRFARQLAAELSGR